MKRLFAALVLMLALSGVSMAADYDGFANFYNPDANKMVRGVEVPSEAIALNGTECFCKSYEIMLREPERKPVKEVTTLNGTERWIGSVL